MIRQLKKTKFYVMLIGDAAIFSMACVGAYLLRFEFVLSPLYLKQVPLLACILVPTKLVLFCIFGLYRRLWRYSSISDFWRLGQATLIAALMAPVVTHLLRIESVPKSVFLLDAILTVLMAGGLRVGIRSYHSGQFTPKRFGVFGSQCGKSLSKSEQNILIIGAGCSGEKMIREIFDNPHLKYNVIGFLDDDPGKWGRTVHGKQIFGGVGKLPKVLEEYSVNQVFISMPSATGAELRRVTDICKSCEVPFKTLPGIGEIIDGKVTVKALREVNYADLLRRRPVQLDKAGIQEYLFDSTVLVTGCGGSIGSELCRQLVRFQPKELILLDACEENLFNMEMELSHEIGYHDYHCILGRVQERRLMREVFSQYRPRVVFHAAAYKHVPMLERNPWEAVLNNVLGSQVLMELAVEFGVRHFVNVSTDKAVRPTSVMGASKRLTELIMQSLRGNGTKFRAVRFGNVVGSSGSVFPLFRRQIEQGGPVTVTHPEVTRYFMTIPEAAQLILEAGALGDEGRLFILEMGTPVKIAEMARDLIRLSGKEPGKDIEVQFTGLRPGEKLYEELITNGENVIKTRHEKIMVVKTNGVWNDSAKQRSFRRSLNEHLRELYALASRYDACGIKRKLKEIIPEYCPQDAECVLQCDRSLSDALDPLSGQDLGDMILTADSNAAQST